jgi:two-component system response regulator MtrA
MPDRILVVEDDDRLGAQIVDHLRRAGFETTWMTDGDDARGVDLAGVTLVVLDLMLPGTYGMDLLKLYRSRSEVPVLILSARDDASDKVRALKLGADDYVTKPFWPEELVARVNARLRRPALRRSDVVRVAGLTIDLEGRSVEGPDGAIQLTRVEFDLLAALARRPGAAITRVALVDAALDPDKEGSERTLDVHVSRLRKKLGPAGAAIATVWGIGYRLGSEAAT